MNLKKFFFYPALFSIVIIILTLPGTVIAEETQHLQTWYENTIRMLEQKEYHITCSDDNKYQSPNRTQNLRFQYYHNGFSVKTRTIKVPQYDLNDPSILGSDKRYCYLENWRISLTLLGYGKGSCLIGFSGRDLIVNRNYASIEDDKMVIEYLNDKNGMRQNFIVKNKPAGDDDLRIVIKTSTDLKLNISDQNISFTDNQEKEKLRYSSLKVWDANNLPLKAKFEKYNPNAFAIVVHDEQADYPITIDPLSTSPDWSKTAGQASANYGFALATAGDVNGDGYSDIMIGAPYYDNGQSNEGAIFGYYGSASGPSSSQDWFAESNQTDANFGYSLATAGDVNGDGYSDVVVGAPLCENGQSDEGIIYIFHGSSSGLSASSSYQREVDQASAQFGFSVSTAGDVNGDGYSDVIASALYYDSGQTDEGKVFVYHGSSGGLSASPDWDHETNQASAQFGYAVSTAGDVNGDGYSDVIIGGPYLDNGQVDEGLAIGFYGSSSGLATSWSWYKESDAANARFGFSVSTAGDANGDGYSDVLVGTPYWENGVATMYPGGSGGLSTTPIWGPSEGSSWIRFGYSLACAGDINGDGFADVIVGAPEYSDGQSNEGRAYIYYGNSSGASATADWTFESDQVSAYLGQCVATAGDVNGDGYSDVLVGAPSYDDTQTDEGKVYLYFGASQKLSTSCDWVIESNEANAWYGYSVSTAGDVNGDGYSDVIIGDPYAEAGMTDRGYAFVYLGASDGLATSAVWSKPGSYSGELFSYWASTAGDVNGDGYSDVIVSEPREEDYAFAYNQMDHVQLYYGTSSGVSSSYAWQVESGGVGGSGFGRDCGTAGDVNGDGYSDVIFGQYTTGGIGKVHGYYGSSSGLSEDSDWYVDGATYNDNPFGSDISTAGDVNGDGYSDVIVGGNTALYAFYGSDTGLPTSYSWKNEMNEFISSVATAGDVNGDGYSDVIVGLRGYDNGQTDEGEIYIYYGSSTGLSNASFSQIESNIESAFFGGAVSTAGDVNNDGYSDVIVGVIGCGIGGRAWIYLGSASGIVTDLYWYTDELNASGARLGSAVSSAGDVNGDGFSDVVIGAPFYTNGQNYEGLVRVYYGNDGSGLRHTLQQYQYGTSDIMGPDDMSSSSGQIRLNTFAKSPYGSTNGKLVYEFAKNGSSFSNALDGSGTQSAYTDLSTSPEGVQLTEDINGLTAGKNYRWRTRIKYETTSNPYQVYGPWFYYSNYQPFSFGSVKSSAITEVPLPITLASFSAVEENGSVILKWTTATETENSGFIIQRKTAETDWQTLVDFHSDPNLEGAGTSSKTHNYNWLDENAEPGATYQYRLGDIDHANKIVWHDAVEITVSEELAQIPAEFGLQNAFPNPFNPTLTIHYGLTEDAQTSVKILDLQGKIISTLSNKHQKAGSYELHWTANGVPSGMYLVEVVSNGNKDLKKVLLAK